MADQEISEFTDGGTPSAGNYVAGYASANTVGGNRRWSFTGIAAFINANLSNAAVIAKVLTGYVSGAGTVAAGDSILQAVQKLNGNTAAVAAGLGSIASQAANNVNISGGAIAGVALASSNTFAGTAMVAAANTVTLKKGANGKTGTVTLNGVTPVTVTNSSITADSGIIFTLVTPGGTVGAYPAIQTKTPTTGFTVAGTALDTSVYKYDVIESVA